MTSRAVYKSLRQNKCTTYNKFFIILQPLFPQSWSLQRSQPVAVPVNPLIVAMAPAFKMHQHLPLLIINLLNSRWIPECETQTAKPQRLLSWFRYNSAYMTFQKVVLTLCTEKSLSLKKAK